MKQNTEKRALSRGEARFLEILRAEQAPDGRIYASNSELGARLNVSRPAISQLINRLILKGYLQRNLTYTGTALVRELTILQAA